MKNTQDISTLVKKYVHGECTHEELDYALGLFEEPYQNIALRPQLYKIWDEEDFDVDNMPSEIEFTQVLDRVHHEINLKNKKQKVSKIKQLVVVSSKIAAILFIGVLFGILTIFFQKSEPIYFTSVAPKGCVSNMVLPDNTIVYLNAGSELKYVINGNENKREVYLVGEAWFDVEKDKQKKFTVHTPFYDVNVLGTEFNVKAYPEDDHITTTLEKGGILISSTEKFKIKNNQILKPGEQLIYDKVDNRIELKKVNPLRYTAWKDNKLIFIDMSLKDLIVLLERKYGVDIEVDDASLLELHYDGTLRNETILEVLEILKETLPVLFTIEEQQIHITKTN